MNLFTVTISIVFGNRPAQTGHDQMCAGERGASELCAAEVGMAKSHPIRAKSSEVEADRRLSFQMGAPQVCNGHRGFGWKPASSLVRLAASV